MLATQRGKFDSAGTGKFFATGTPGEVWEKNVGCKLYVCSLGKNVREARE